MLRNNYFDVCSYVYEQSGESNETLGHNNHIHMLTVKHVAKSKLIDQLFKSLSSVLSMNNIHVECVLDSERDKIENYMQGIKTPDKMNKVLYNDLWRKKYNIPSIITVDNKTIIKQLDCKISKPDEDYNTNIVIINDKKYVRFKFNGKVQFLEFNE